MKKVEVELKWEIILYVDLQSVDKKTRGVCDKNTTQDYC